MTFLFIESWKTTPTAGGLTRRWSYQYGNGGLVRSDGLFMNGNQVSYCNTHISTVTEMMMGFWFTPFSYAATTVNMSFLHILNGGESNSQNQLGFGLNPNGTLAVFQGPNFSNQGGTTIFNGTKTLFLNTRYWIELHMVSHATAGVFEVRINGNVECNLTGINSAPYNGPGITGISLTSGAGTTKTFGGMYVATGSTFLGPCEIERLYPVGWTGDTDPSYSPVDGLFDATHVANPGGSTQTLKNPSYDTTTIFGIQSTRWVTTGPSAFFSIDTPNTGIPVGGIQAPSGALYYEAIMSSTKARPRPSSARRKYSSFPG